jgi:hypothetical protein
MNEISKFGLDAQQRKRILPSAPERCRLCKSDFLVAIKLFSVPFPVPQGKNGRGQVARIFLKGEEYGGWHTSVNN